MFKYYVCMKFTIIIPSRFGSERFPGKPLTMIKGKLLIERVWLLANAVSEDIEVVVATDSKKISDAVKEFGGKVVMTREDCRNGSERVYEAYNELNNNSDVVINLQGDAVITPPWVIESLCKIFKEKDNVEVATCATVVSSKKLVSSKKDLEAGNISGTYVVMDKNSDALYFSRYPIPYLRKESASLGVYRHIGIYAYTPKMLETYINLAPSELEKIEGLEQLRLLYHGYKMQVVEVDYKGRSHLGVDTELDKERVIKVIEEEGELLS